MRAVVSKLGMVEAARRGVRALLRRKWADVEVIPRAYILRHGFCRPAFVMPVDLPRQKP